MTTLVSIEAVSHAFGAAKVLDDVSLNIDPGSYTVLLGPSGSGKTTLLSILGGFLMPTSGRVLIKGEDCTAMPPARRPTATVFQDYALFPHMTVGSNVGFGLRMQGVAKTEREEKARQMLEVVGLAAALAKRPHELSGGQRQRVALARALVVAPAVLLLDEPLGALDLKLRRQMQDELKAIQQRVGTAFVHVTHDQEEAMALADHVVVMNHGRIEDEGKPERVYARPATMFSATFMGESTLFADRDRAMFPALPPVETGEHLAIRPENVRIVPAPGDILLGPANVTAVTFQGSYCRIAARLGAASGPEVLARVRPADAVPVGASVTLSCNPADLVRVR